MQTTDYSDAWPPIKATSSTTGGLRTHALIVLAIVMTAAMCYLPLAQANYCGFDDTLDLQRLTFHDPGTIAHDFQTPLYESFKYRPFLTTLNRITLQVGHGKAVYFRFRNILSHLLSTVILYGIGVVLFHSIPVAAGAALLFSIHPLANQTVTGALWVSAQADVCMFLALLLFLISLRVRRWWLPALAASLLIAPLGVFIYDPVIVFYGLIPIYIFAWVLTERQVPPLRYLVTLGVLAIGFVILWFRLRTAFLPAARSINHVTPIATIIKNIFIYCVGLTQVFDPVLANDVIGTPLPNEALNGTFTIGWLVLLTLPAITAVVMLLGTLRRWRSNLTRRDLILFGFLLVGWAGSLVPSLFFSDHASETYNYLGVAFLSFVAVRVLCAIATPPGGGCRPDMRIFASVIGVLALLYGAATVDRNIRVKSCGNTLGNILQQLPWNELQHGKWDVIFSNVPDELTSRAYGMYGYKGIDTLGFGDYGTPGIAAALQYKSNNTDISAEALSTKDFLRTCGEAQPNRMCFWVHANGNLHRLQPGISPVVPPPPQSF